MKAHRPPRLALMMLKWIMPEAIYDDVSGDLVELFHWRIKRKGLFNARLYFVKDTFFSMRNISLRRKITHKNSTAMFKNYFKVAYRNIVRHKFYSFANTFSLAFGIASTLLIALFVKSELSFDNFHTNSEQLYRLNKYVNSESGVTKSDESSGLFGPTMVTEFPEVLAASRYEGATNVALTHNEKSIRIPRVSYVDDNFFEVFDFKLLKGNPSDVLTRPSTLVLTENTAYALFGDENPINKVVRAMGAFDYIVTGIVANPPKNSHLQFNALASWSTTVPGVGPLNRQWMNNWGTQGISTYLLLDPSSDVKALEAKFPAFEVKHMPDRAERYDMYLQPFNEVYLKSADIRFSKAMTGTRFIYILASVALAILLIAIFNYVNISTAKATVRSKEVGVRKVIGARKKQLILQHLVESLVMVLLATLIGGVLVALALPTFNEFTSRTLALTDIDTLMSLTILGLILLITLISGIYPALMIAGFKTISVLRGRGNNQQGNLARQLLITFQFVITIVMIAAAAMISRQTNFIQSVDLGYDEENVLMTEFSDAIYEDSQPFVDALKANQYTSEFALSQQTPVMSNIGYSVYLGGLEESEVSVRLFRVDDKFIDFYDMNLLTGRNLDRKIVTDRTAVIINETMLKLTGWDEPIGKTLHIGNDGPLFTVIGVVEDFNFRSLRSEVQPIVMQGTNRPYSLSIKVTEATRANAVAALQDIWAQYEPSEPLSYSFLEDNLTALYDNENNILKAIMIFAVISILISCFGLYGLTAFTVERKFKEIGIRKALGAGESSILYMINKRFMVITMLAFVLAMPLAWYLITQWLQGFAYRAPLGADIFLIALSVTLLITVATISLQTLKAARTNPVKALRME
ncbi:MAG: FtsX-like permease family protein [Roseivirga sp.]|nr:FtsX-like permease family protein [Roseivirga sp.]